MDRVKTILRYEWRAYWRRLSRAGLRGSNQGIVLILSVLIAFKYLQLLRIAAANVDKGDSKLVVQLLGAIFMVWLFPLGSNARQTFASRRWLHLPLSVKERFIVRAVSIVMPPSAWLAIVASVLILYPLAQARNPVAGVVAGFLFIAVAWLNGLAISHLLNFVGWRKLFWIASLGLLVAVGSMVIRDGTVKTLSALQIFPATLAVRVAMGDVAAGEAANQWTTPLVSLALLALCAVAAGLVSLWSFRKWLSAAPVGVTHRIFVVPSYFITGRLGGLVGKDFRYFRRLLDTYLGLAASILGCFCLIVSETPSAGVFWSFIVATFLGNAAVAFNSFGLDNRAGLDRYALLPVSGEDILLSKNLAYLVIVLFEILPMLLIAGWRLGVVTSILGLVQAVGIAGAYLTWGNWMSVNHPLKMQFFRFANSSAALVDAMGGLFFGSLPGIVMIYLWQRQGADVVGLTALVLVTTVALYLLSIKRYGRSYEQNREGIVAAL